MTSMELDRRRFMVASVSAAGGLMLGFHIPGRADAAAIMDEPWMATDGGHEVNAWLVIDPDNSVTIRVGQSDMGEGVFTGMPMLVAEELECDWSSVRAVYADVNRHVRSTVEPYMVAAGAARETDGPVSADGHRRFRCSAALSEVSHASRRECPGTPEAGGSECMGR